MNFLKYLFYIWLVCLYLFCSPAQAQLGAHQYSFHSRSELRSLLVRNKTNPQALYDLAILAHRRGWLGTAINTGEEMLNNDKHDPYIQALVAFCVYTGLYARNWDWPIDQAAGDLWSRQSLASLFQRESLKVQNPAIQLMTAISLANMPTSRGFNEALRLFRLVLKSQPNWADAHYWYGRAIDRASSQKPKLQRQQALRQSLAQYNRAEQLDSSLYSFLLFDRFTALDSLDRPSEALGDFEAYLRIYPAFAQNLEERFPDYVAKTRERLTKKMQQKEVG